MSAVLHPVGPEEPRTYWIRRVVVLVSVLLVVLVVLWALRPAGAGVQAVPGPDPSAPVPGSTPTPASEPTSSPGPEPTTSPSSEPTPSSSPTPSEPSTDGDDGTDQEKAEQKKAEEKKAEQKKADQENEPQACRGEDVGVALDGSSRPEPGEDHDLEVALTNRSSGPCDLTLDQSTFELRVFSGTDEIWTTDHCTDWLAVEADDRTLTLESDETHRWTPTWPVQRSEDGCELVDETLGSGTYVATAIYAEAEPAQLVMVLR